MRLFGWNRDFGKIYANIFSRTGTSTFVVKYTKSSNNPKWFRYAASFCRNFAPEEMENKFNILK